MMNDLPRYLVLSITLGLFISLWRNYLRSWIGTLFTRMDSVTFNLFSTSQPYANLAPEGSYRLHIKYSRWKKTDDFIETAALVFIVGIEEQLEITRKIPFEAQIIACIVLSLLFIRSILGVREEDFS